MKQAGFLILVFLCTSCYARNAVVLLADDAGQRDFQVYGNKAILTPNVDQLGKMGTVFTNAFTSVSSCSPSRSAVLTGMPNHQNGMYGLHHSVHHFNSFDNAKSIPILLKEYDGGIRTGIIGKKHVGPEYVYPFDFEHTEETESMMQVGRNITRIKDLLQQFLDGNNEGQDFFLYIGFHDPHRCGHSHPEYGAFCQFFGNGQYNNGTIPDWKPIHYEPNQVEVPYYVQDTPAAREDIAKQYTTISRLDQGVGLVMNELKKRNLLEETLVLLSSDNGIPFTSGRTNVYEPGIREPLIVYAPSDKQDDQKKVVDDLTTLLDITPTVLDWFGVDTPKELTGVSLLKLMNPRYSNNRTAVFGSHSLHEVTMDYPMRYMRTNRFKLIHNIGYQSPFMIDQDFYISATFQDLLYRTQHNISTHWYKTIEDYYYRPEWELFDLKVDPEEEFNLAEKPRYKHVFENMKRELNIWQNMTMDPWICAPHSILQAAGPFKFHPRCMPLYN